MGVDHHCSDISQDLYRIYHYYPFDIAIFLSSKFNNETAQFISEFYSSGGIKFFIYHDEHNEEIISSFSTAAINLVHTKSSNSVLIPELINQFLFYNLKMPRKKNRYAVFLDGIKEIPDNLNANLYPNTKLNINMFNSSYVQNPQNIGLISEIEKAQILNTYEFFIDIKNNYSHEAKACGAKALDPDGLKEKTKSNKNTKKVQTYEEFIRLNIL
jgi:hypothetical protein